MTRNRHSDDKRTLTTQITKGLVPHELLSDRENRVFLGLASGHKLYEIAEALSVSPNTISTYRMRVLKKLNLQHNAQLILLAYRMTQP